MLPAVEVALQTLAAELSTTDRTLRRAVARGLLRAERVSPRKLEIPVAERDFLRRSWSLLSRLQATLRTEPVVSLAVLFGSAARGEMHAESDVDLLISTRAPGSERALVGRLADRLGIPVQIVLLEDAERAPILLAEVLRDGRVLVDRAHEWAHLRKLRPKVEQEAARERRRIEQEFSERFPA